MSEFNVEVVKLDKVEKHPNADTLSICHVHGGYPVVFKTDSFPTGDKAVYIPVDSMVPVEDERFAFLATGDKKVSRIKAKRLRGVFSMGMLVPAEPDWQVGQNVQDLLNITKWEPVLKARNVNAYCEQEADPGIIPKYTDLVSIRRYPDILTAKDEIIVTEKIHGTNARFVHDGDRLWVGTHKTFRKPDARNVWWETADKYNIEKKLYEFQNIGLYGEIYGQVQDLKYGAGKDELFFAAFDAFDCKSGQYLDYARFTAFCDYLDIPTVPVLYKGLWSEHLKELAEGKSTIADHVREGFVVRLFKERWHDEIGRVALKLVGQDYLLRKD